jgi:hypothetical protein
METNTNEDDFIALEAMDASFPPDRWPATKMVEPNGVVRFVLKDGTEIYRVGPPPENLGVQDAD